MSASTNLQVEGAVDTILFCATVGSVSESCEWMGEKDLQDVCEVGSHVSTGVRWIVFVYDKDVRWMVVEVSYIGATR